MGDDVGMAEGVDDLLGLMWHAPRPVNTLWCPCGCGNEGDTRVPQRVLRDAGSLDEYLKCVGVREKKRQKLLEQYVADSSKFSKWVRIAASGSKRAAQPLGCPRGRHLCVFLPVQLLGPHDGARGRLNKKKSFSFTTVGVFGRSPGLPCCSRLLAEAPRAPEGQPRVST